jgi:hypothetical protein
LAYWETMGNELRHTIRGLAKDRGFTAMVVLSLAVGIGAITAIFSLVNGVLLRPPAYRDPERLVAAAQIVPSDAGGAIRSRGAGAGGVRNLRGGLLCGGAPAGGDGDSLALGAARGNVLGMVLRQGMMPVVAGLAAGAVLALAIGRYLASLLFEVSPRDPLAFAAAGTVLMVVSAVACLVPARRATKVNPIEALRVE